MKGPIIIKNEEYNNFFEAENSSELSKIVIYDPYPIFHHFKISVADGTTTYVIGIHKT